MNGVSDPIKMQPILTNGDVHKNDMKFFDEFQVGS